MGKFHQKPWLAIFSGEQNRRVKHSDTNTDTFVSIKVRGKGKEEKEEKERREGGSPGEKG